MTASEMLNGMSRRLEEQPPSGAIPEAQILDPACEPSFYTRRWVLPTNQSGSYVARRPQAHGAALWGFAALANGAITKFLDFPLRGARWRGCDVAWQLQMAIDDRAGTPQTYPVRLAHPWLPQLTGLLGDQTFSKSILRRPPELDHFLRPFFAVAGLARNSCWLSSQISSSAAFSA